MADLIKTLPDIQNYDTSINYNPEIESSGYDSSDTLGNLNLFNSMNNSKSLNTGITNPNLGSLSMSDQLMQSQKSYYDLQVQNQQDYADSFMGKISPYVKAGTAATQSLASIANIYTGFQQLKIADKTLGIAEDKWKTTKSELARVNNVRSKLNAQYG